MAAVTGEPAAVATLLSGVAEGFEVLGPVPADRGAARDEARSGPDRVRALVRAPRDEGAALARALHAAQAARSARKDAGPVRVQLDPAELI
jgi:primosomal protein N' (replication factor Y)